jgi:LmbE family N-acetylglucosaminyl deacetylase
MDNTIAWMVAKPIQDERERELRESAEARELRSIVAMAGAGRPVRTPLTVLAQRLGSVVSRTSTEPSGCPA